MAISVFPTSAVAYDDLFWSGATEIIDQEIDVLNAGSNGALLTVSQRHIGDFQKMSFLKSLSMISHRDTTAVAPVTPLAATFGEHVAAKTNRQIGPVDMTMDIWKKIGDDPATMFLLLGQQAGLQIVQDYVNTLILALSTAIQTVAALTYDGTASTMNHTSLKNGLSLFGDRANSIRTLVMHSKVYYDLMGAAIALSSLDSVAGLAINSGTIGSFNRTVVVTDSPSLILAGPQYVTLGLVSGAGVVQESEERTIYNQVVTGLPNLVQRLQGEHAFTINLLGYKYAGARNPNNTVVGTGASWVKDVTSNKDTAGFAIVTD